MKNTIPIADEIGATMTGEVTSRDEKSTSDTVCADVAKETSTGAVLSLEVSIRNGEEDSLNDDSGDLSWMVVFSCFLLNFNLLGINYAYGVYQAHYLLHQFPNDSAQLISLIGSICIALTTTIGVPVGRSVEIFGFRKVAVCGSIVFCGALVAASFCRTVPTLIITQGILSGIGAGILFIPATTAPAQRVLKRRSLSIGVSSAGSGVGGIFWSFFIRIVITRMGYQWALRLSGFISAGINVVALCMLKTRPLPPNSRQSSIWSGLVMIKDPKFFTLYCASGVSIFGYMVPFFYVPTYAQTQLQSSALVGSTLSAILDLGMVIGRIVLGLAADSGLGTMNTVISGMALAGLCQFVFWLPASNSLPLLYVFAFAYGFLGGGYIGLLPAVLAHIFDPDKLPTITGLFLTSELPGQLTGGPIAGVILSRSNGHWTPLILYSGFTFFFGSVFAIITRFQVNRRVFVTI